MQPQHTLAIFEAGISRPGEMARLERIIRPDIGIFTNIGPAHREGFASNAEKVREKMILFEGAGVLIYCVDQEEVSDARLPQQDFSWSRKGREADIQVTAVQLGADGWTSISTFVAADGRTAQFKIPFQDAASIENAIHCWVMLHWMGIAHERIRERMATLEPVEMRLELKAGINRSTLINDSYSNDLSSLRIALNFAAQQNRTGRFTLILSDILQSGLTDRALYRQVAQLLEEKGVGRLIGIGPAIPAIRAVLPAGMEAFFYPDTHAFIQDLAHLDFSDELILVKGARIYAFERIAARLEQKSHKTVLEVNLNALVHNLNVYNRLLKPDTRIMAMVKAAAYGSGSAEVAKLLAFHQVDYLGVAYTDEGIELRQSGIQLPILVLNPEPASFDALYRHRLEPEVYNLAQLLELTRFAGHDRQMAIHLKLDTGMHRLGFEPNDLGALIDVLKAYPNLPVRSVFTHLSSSDNPGHDDFTHRQAAVFAESYGQIREALGYAPLRHILNTGGIARFAEYQFDMVRLGIGLYGIDSSGLQDQLRVVNTLKATISQIKDVSPGETIGYNRNGPVLAPSRIATISIGYADGLLRLAGNGRYQVLVHEKPAPTIGNICMDMSMVDVTDIPEAREGDEVIIFGDGHPVQELARTMQTIPYEVFTNISERVKRVYFQE
jgi:alanine racemase